MTWSDEFDDANGDDSTARVRITVTYANEEYIHTLGLLLDSMLHEKVEYDDIEEQEHKNSAVRVFDVIMFVPAVDISDSSAYREAHYERPVALVKAALAEFDGHTGVQSVEIKPVF